MMDLWPDDINIPGVTAPSTILKEQASLLGNKTKNIVKANVVPAEAPLGRGFGYEFRIFAPTLEGYTIELFNMWHDIELYPVYFRFDITLAKELDYRIKSGNLYNCIARDEDEFIKILGEIFNAGRTIRIIKSLLAQNTDRIEPVG